MPTPHEIENGPLCVGGPYDGRRVLTRDNHPRFVASESDRIGGVARYRQVIYGIQTFGAGDQVMLFWAPAGQTEMETMVILARVYEEARGGKR